ncbi:hypothetical protein J4468_02785 [Candidatus Woesearchaeota archaeon]|nr:hypothetical protein [Candidatus Woesearchaeota archaeon]
MGKVMVFLNLCSVLLLLLSMLYLARGIKYEKPIMRKSVKLAIFALFMLALDRAVYVISNAPFVSKVPETVVNYSLIAANFAFLPLAAGAIIIFAVSLKNQTGSI